MYVPSSFRETDLSRLHDFIERHSFGMLVSEVEGRPFCSHLPFLLRRDEGPLGTLIGHVATANPHWQHLDRNVLCVFTGPHAYISPAWYEAEGVVPTWNYTAVHARGECALIREPAELLALVGEFVERFEAGRASPWTLDREAPYVRGLLPAIVGFRLRILELDGKWKLGQNHSRERREKVAAALEREESGAARDVASLMRESLHSPPGRS